MIAWAGLPSHPSIHSRVGQKRGERGVEQQMINSEAGIGLPVVAKKVPEGVDGLFGKAAAESIGPPLQEEALKALAALGLEQSVFNPGARVVNIKIGRDDVEISGQGHGVSRLTEGIGVGNQAAEPFQFVIKLRAGLRISIGQVEAADEHSIDRRLQIAAVGIGFVARQTPSGLNGIGASGQNRHAVPGLLAMPKGSVPGVLERVGREVEGFEFLEAGDVRLFPLEPFQKVWQASRDPIDIERGDLHGLSLWILPEANFA